MSETIGGQAVIEGVMMRNKAKLAIAVRKGSKIIIKEEKIKSLADKITLFKLPFFRGILALFETLVIGIKALNYSADLFVGKKEKLSGWAIALTLFAALVFALVLFKLLPLAIAQLLSGTFYTAEDNIIFNLVEGFFKALIFVLYIVLIGFMKDVKRLFQYHGAEHKTVNCYEAKKKLTVENIKKYSTLHPRCGTSFLIFVILVSIVVYSLLPYMGFWLKLFYRILLLPIIAGVAYEIIKLSGKYNKNRFLKLLIKPGLWVQKITTKEPDARMIEVAVKALKAVI